MRKGVKKVDQKIDRFGSTQLFKKVDQKIHMFDSTQLLLLFSFKTPIILYS